MKRRHVVEQISAEQLQVVARMFVALKAVEMDAICEGNVTPRTRQLVGLALESVEGRAL